MGHMRVFDADRKMRMACTVAAGTWVLEEGPVRKDAVRRGRSGHGPAMARSRLAGAEAGRAHPQAGSGPSVLVRCFRQMSDLSLKAVLVLPMAV